MSSTNNMVVMVLCACNYLSHWGWDKMAAISQTTFLNGFFLNENTSVLVFHWSLFLGPIINMPAIVQIMTWRRPGDKPLSEPMMVNLLTHLWGTRPQWVIHALNTMLFQLISVSNRPLSGRIYAFVKVLANIGSGYAWWPIWPQGITWNYSVL